MKLADKNFETATINVSRDWKEKMATLSKQKGDLSIEM